MGFSMAKNTTREVQADAGPRSRLVPGARHQSVGRHRACGLEVMIPLIEVIRLVP